MQLRRYDDQTEQQLHVFCRHDDAKQTDLTLLYP